MRKAYEEIFNIMGYSIDVGITHLTDRNPYFDGTHAHIDGKDVKSFLLCDYLGLSVDDRLKEGAIEASKKYGVFTSVTRISYKLKIYEEAEELVSRIFGKPVILVSRTSLGHISALPILIDANDAIILDHQVHTSVRLAADILRGYGNYTETIRHNRMDILEERIKDLKSKYDKIWYLADGIYSMHGDGIPASEVERLMNTYEQFHVYVDDAHGMSWAGKNGQGYVLNEIDYHPQLFVITSLAKGFGTGGSVLICPDELTKQYIVRCGAPIIFSGPVSPPTLGSIIESSKIHLSKEIKEKQSLLAKKIKLFSNYATKAGLPIVDNSDSPIFFIAAGKPDMAVDICRGLLDHGFLTTGGIYPATPINNSGVRILLTLYESEKDITRLVDAMQVEYEKALTHRNIKLEDVLKHYKRLKLVIQ